MFNVIGSNLTNADQAWNETYANYHVIMLKNNCGLTRLWRKEISKVARWTIFAPSMSSSTKKRTLDSFFSPVTHKKARTGESAEEEAGATANPNSSCHSNYPFPIPYLPSHIYDRLPDLPAAKGREIRDQPDLDLVYFQPYISKCIERDLFEFLRRELFFYRVRYTIKRGPTETQINTPR